MSITWPGTITGAAQTGFTTPAYVATADTAPAGNPGKQVAITGITGTQAGVTLHSVSSPFTMNFYRPSNLRVLGSPNPVTGVITQVPTNTYGLIGRKGVTTLTGQPIKVSLFRATWDVPAGSDTADAPNLRALASCAIGSLWGQSAGFGDLAISGVL